MNQQLVIDIPFSDNLKISSRSKKYVTCLQMVHKVLSREISENISLEQFNHLGIVAGFIDQHLDQLSIDEQRILLLHYDRLFDKLWDVNHYLIFRNEICEFVEQHQFVFNCEGIHLKDLFLFLQHCKSLAIKDDIQSFGRSIINIAIQKQEATKSNALIDLLRLEGEAVIGLLKALLYKEHNNSKSFKPTLNLLRRLEHILNVADDTLDINADRKKNIINPNVSALHRLNMIRHLVGQIAGTIISFPIKTAYYGPRLTWYYFSKTLR